MIEVERLSKTFRVYRKQPGLIGSLKALVRRQWLDREAVRRVSFSVGEGEIVGLVGANGAGKTTLVKMLAGIIHPSSGDARILGYRPWERDNRLRSRIALIMGQKAQLWWDLPAADCFLLLKDIYRIPEDAYRRNLDILSEMLQVRDLLQIQIRRLSLGERMKMELIAALLHGPRVVYLDEPTIGLDVGAQRSIRDFLLEYRAEHQPAMILTSHYMEDIERLCKRILILRDGELVFDGQLAKVVETYARHKVVTAHLREGSVSASNELLRSLPGRVIEHHAQTLRIRAPRASVAAVAAAILESCDVVDLSIEEMEIGSIIEKIIHSRSPDHDSLPSAQERD